MPPVVSHPSQVKIRYHRPPDRLDVFDQQLIADWPDCKITLHDPSPITAPLYVGGRLIHEPGAAIVWFVFPDRWYDVGRFHLGDGTFTGYYVNLIAPPLLDGSTWTLYDLCLDLWVDPHGRYLVLDRDEFDEAVDRHWLDHATAQRAGRELDRLIETVDHGNWPPQVIATYDLERVRREMGWS